MTYASGCGVYGDIEHVNATEDHGPMHPISTYGASKLGCEALISAYCHMFGLHASRVPLRERRRAATDARRDVRLRAQAPARSARRLEIFGDGSQRSPTSTSTTSSARCCSSRRQEPPGFEVFNVGTDDHVTVREIADLAVERLGLDAVEYEFTGGNRGWKGDVPSCASTPTEIRARGWSNRLHVGRGARRLDSSQHRRGRWPVGR